VTKKERIEYLESEVAGLHAKVAELIERVRQLEVKLNDYWLLDKNSPNVVTFPNINEAIGVTSWIKCPNCGGTYPPGQHNACWTYNPNLPYTVTFTNKTEVLK
jgi:hypothetical protein